jgi:hypothetical protein
MFGLFRLLRYSFDPYILLKNMYFICVWASTHTFHFSGVLQVVFRNINVKKPHFVFPDKKKENP